MANDGNLGAFFNGFVIGGVVGTVMALLFAPQSGEKMRSEIKDKAEATYIEAQRKISEALTDLQTKIDKVSADVTRSSPGWGKTYPTKLGIWPKRSRRTK
ncbi:MAG: YtxH domain-containing protein [Chloroflexota bacterium]